MMVKIMGHRGAPAEEPENTLRSFRRALDLGVAAVELDVQLTRDGRLAVIHDETLDRTTNGRGLVKDFTLAELQKLDAGQGEPIPALEEVLELVQGPGPPAGGNEAAGGDRGPAASSSGNTGPSTRPWSSPSGTRPSRP